MTFVDSTDMCTRYVLDPSIRWEQCQELFSDYLLYNIGKHGLEVCTA